MNFIEIQGEIKKIVSNIRNGNDEKDFLTIIKDLEKILEDKDNHEEWITPEDDEYKTWIRDLMNLLARQETLVKRKFILYSIGVHLEKK